MLDLNDDNHLSSAEIDGLGVHLNGECSDWMKGYGPDVSATFSAIDTNGDDKITSEEFAKAEW
jgi:hypothetical protein